MILLCSCAILPAISAKANFFTGGPINQGASSSYSPFHHLSTTLSDGWRIRLRSEHDVLLYSPPHSAAGPLESFYQSLLARAKAKMLSNAPPITGSALVRLGSLILIVSAPSIPMPWLLIALFAGNMLDATRRGYTVGYTVNIQPPGADAPNVIRLSLFAVDVPLPGPSGSPISVESASSVNDLETDEELYESENEAESACKRQCIRPDKIP